MIKTKVITKVDFSAIIYRFCNLTGWSSDHNGTWNANFNAPIVFHAILGNIYHKEQDWLAFYYPDNYENITMDKASLLIDSTKTEYRGKNVFSIPFGAIIRWLVIKNELSADIDEFLVKH